MNLHKHLRIIIILAVIALPVNLVASDLPKILPRLMDATVSIKLNKQVSATPNKAAHNISGVGSGVIIDAKKGYILTNAHVVGSNKKVTIELNNRRYISGTVIGAGRRIDIAVVQVNDKNLTAMPIGNSRTLRLGESVFAIGSPYGLKASVSSGIVSALERNGVEGNGEVENYIQTDVAVNPGNSGGPLINMQGKLIGINVSIYSPNDANSGISLAIPIATAMHVAKQLIKYGYTRYGSIGATFSDVQPDMAQSLNLETHYGALVTSVIPNGPAAKIGLRVGDQVKKLSGYSVKSAGELRSEINLLTPGSREKILVRRKGKMKSFVVTVTDVQKLHEKLAMENPYFHGVILSNQVQRHSFWGIIRGVEVLSEAPGSPAEIAGLKEGDLILAINFKPTPDVVTLDKLLKTFNRHKPITLHIIRQGVKGLISLKPLG